MAEKEIIIRIVNDTTGSTTEESGTQEEVKTSTTSKQKSSNILANITAKSIYDRYKGYAVQVVNYEINKYMNLSDSYMASQNLDIAKNISGKLLSIGMAYIIGGPVLGTLNLIGQVIGTGIQTYQNYDQERIKLRQMEKQLSYSRERAGYSLTSGSIGENR